jgi:hypothetical protein
VAGGGGGAVGGAVAVAVAQRAGAVPQSV